jgi:hypothetical protein
VLMSEPAPGYYASDPVWPPEICAELYALMGSETATHFHPVPTNTPEPVPAGFGLGPFGEGPFGGS